VTSRADEGTPRITVTLDADFGYSLALHSREPVEHLLTLHLRQDLATWLEFLERGNPSDPGHPGLTWVAEARTLRERMQAELGSGFEVVWAPDERRRQQAQDK
jgi:hypothetical protein